MDIKQEPDTDEDDITDVEHANIHNNRDEKHPEVKLECVSEYKDFFLSENEQEPDTDEDDITDVEHANIHNNRDEKNPEVKLECVSEYKDFFLPENEQKPDTDEDDITDVEHANIHNNRDEKNIEVKLECVSEYKDFFLPENEQKPDTDEDDITDVEHANIHNNRDEKNPEVKLECVSDKDFFPPETKHSPSQLCSVKEEPADCEDSFKICANQQVYRASVHPFFQSKETSFACSSLETHTGSMRDDYFTDVPSDCGNQCWSLQTNHNQHADRAVSEVKSEPFLYDNDGDAVTYDTSKAYDTSKPNSVQDNLMLQNQKQQMKHMSNLFSSDRCSFKCSQGRLFETLELRDLNDKQNVSEFPHSSSVNNKAKHVTKLSMLCKKCDITFSVREMRLHVAEKHPSDCPFNKTFDSNSIQGHSKSHKSQAQELHVKRHTCYLCPFSCNLLFELCQHKISHTVDSCYTCDFCQSWYRDFLDLKIHLSLHLVDVNVQMCGDDISSHHYNQQPQKLNHGHGFPLVCEICHILCRDIQELERHKLVHRKVRQFYCDKCPYTCVDEQDFEMHKVKHVGEKQHVSQAMISSSADDGNMKTHSGRLSYFCDVCGDVFTKLCLLKSHKQKEHWKKFSCNLCDFSSIYLSELLAHMAKHTAGEKPENHVGTHTGVKPPSTKHRKFTNAEPQKVEKTYSMCVDKQDFEIHKVKHVGEKQHVSQAMISSSADDGNMKTHPGGLSYLCTVCRFSFKFQDEMRRHVAEKHTKGKKYPCDVCGDVFTKLCLLRSHKRKEHRKKFSCNLCDFSSTYLSQLLAHMTKHTAGKKPENHVGTHTGVKPPSTEHRKFTNAEPQKVEKTYSMCVDKQDFEMHKVKHVGEKQHVSQATISSSADDGNMKTHPGGLSYLCRVCRFSCECENKMRRHVAEKHPKVKTYPCSKVKTYPCVVCEGVFTKLCLLKSHIQEEHIDRKKFSCYLCEFSSTYLIELLAHMSKHAVGEKPENHVGTHTGVKPPSTEHRKFTNAEPQKVEKTYSMCVDKQDFEIHKVKHVGEKQHVSQAMISSSADDGNMKTHPGGLSYLCTVCRFSFKSEDEMRRHVAEKHPKVKTYPCNMCGSVFTKLCLLISHKQKHTDQEKFSCNLCDFSSNSSKMLIHMAKHAAGEKPENHVGTHTGVKPPSTEHRKITNKTWPQNVEKLFL